ncbi:MAG: tyrosine-type recombinase/integrase [Bacteroidota bacterium]
MPKKRLSDKAVAKLRHDGRGQYTDFRDAEVAGLGLRIRGTGTKSWYVQLRGSSQRIFFGRWPELIVADARERAIETRRTYAGGKPPQRTVAELVEHYRANHRSRRKGLRPDERKGYGIVLDRIVELFGSLSIDDFGPSQTLEVIRPKSGRDAMQNKWLQVIRGLWSYATELGWYVGASPTRGIRSRPAPARNRAPSDDEIQAIIGALRQHLNPGPRNAIIVAYETAARISEALSLRWEDVDRGREGVPASVLIRETKTGRPRRVPLSAEALRCLDEQRGLTSGAGFIFPGRSLNKPLGWGACNNLMRKARKLSGVEDITIHDLRHARATRWLMDGIPVHLVSRLLGHARVATTLDTYADALDRDALNAWSEKFSAPSSTPQPPPAPMASPVGLQKPA